jgi:phosphoglycolate phosphatase
MDNITTVIFDFDGVVADTESVFAHFDSDIINFYLEKAKIPDRVTPSDIRKLAGGPGIEKLYKIGKSLGIDLSPYEKEFSADRDDRRKTLFSQYEAVLSKNIEALLKKLGKKRSAIATNKLAYKLEQDLKNMGYYHLFVTKITSDPPMQRKPAPDIILEAIKRLDAKPEECAYIGDNKNDMIAAIAAGVTPIGFIIEGLENAPQNAQTLKDHGAIMVIDDFADLIPYI